MNVLFLGYWDIDEPLTAATIFPHLKILQDFDEISNILFVNTERTSRNPLFLPGFTPKKIKYHPLFSKNLKLPLVNKIYDFIRFPQQINRLITEHRIDVVIARGAPAGALAYLACKRAGIRFFVESFEPHAEYMLEGGIWHWFDLRYIFQKRWERLQKKYAAGLLPVSEAYRARLLQEGLDPAKVVTVPCLVDFDKFVFLETTRIKMRKKYRIGPGTNVGIYVGKFGGLYLKEEAFMLFQAAFDHYPDFFLVILTPVAHHSWIDSTLKKYRLPADRIMIKFVVNKVVPDYLMMCDFAFATYKPGSFKAFLSPVKVGEYWACGLPVVLTRGVGDEASIIEENSAGILFDLKDINKERLTMLFQKLDQVLKVTDLRKKLATLAWNTRSREKSIEGYRHFLLNDNAKY